MGVQATDSFRNMVNLLAADTATFASADSEDKPFVMLLKDPFTPAGDLTYPDLAPLEADFDGYTAHGIGCATGTQDTAEDPLTADYLLQLKAPLGGFRWETTGLDNLPQTIYGFAIVSWNQPKCYYSAVFANPITLNAANQVVEVDSAQLRFTPIGVS